MTDACPSRLALDRFALRVDDAATAAHVASCPACAAHLRRISEDVSVPAWARELTRTPLRRQLPRLRWALGPGALAAAAGVALVVVPSSAPYVGMKGGAAAAVYVKRGNAVTRWDGHSALAPGDRIRLELAPTGFTHAHVLAPANGATGWTSLWSGAVDPKRATTLPAAWVLDASPGAERVALIVTNRPLDAEHAAQTFTRGCRDAACVELTLPKAVPDAAVAP